MKGRGPGRILSAAIPLAAGVALLLLVLEKDHAAPPADPVPPPAPAAEPAERPDTPKAPVALTVVSLPAPPPEASRVVEVKPLAVKAPAPKPVAEVHVLRPTPPAPETKPIEVVPMQPKVAEAAPPAPAPEPVVREIVPLQAKQAVAADEPIQEIRPMKAVVRTEEPPVAVIHPLPAAVEPVRPRTPAIEPPAKTAEPPRESAAEPTTVHVSVETGGAVAQEGRALLRLLEHGSGPGIEIAWPAGNGQQTRLYQTLARCYGMRSIVMDGRGNLYVAEGARGHKWDLNLDRFSGFVRQPAGYVAAEERGQAETIRRYHGLGGTAGLVRIFPRAVDAVLLGGLQQILGDGYRDARAIHAVYRLEGNRLFVENIERDGMPVGGRIAFASLSRGACGG